MLGQFIFLGVMIVSGILAVIHLNELKHYPTILEIAQTFFVWFVINTILAGVLL